MHMEIEIEQWMEYWIRNCIPQLESAKTMTEQGLS